MDEDNRDLQPSCSRSENQGVQTTRMHKHPSRGPRMHKLLKPYSR